MARGKVLAPTIQITLAVNVGARGHNPGARRVSEAKFEGTKSGLRSGQQESSRVGPGCGHAHQWSRGIDEQGWASQLDVRAGQRSTGSGSCGQGGTQGPHPGVGSFGPGRGSAPSPPAAWAGPPPGLPELCGRVRGGFRVVVGEAPAVGGAKCAEPPCVREAHLPYL